MRYIATFIVIVFALGYRSRIEAPVLSVFLTTLGVLVIIAVFHAYVKSAREEKNEQSEALRERMKRPCRRDDDTSYVPPQHRDNPDYKRNRHKYAG